MIIQKYIYNLRKAMRESTDATERETLNIKMRYAIAYRQGGDALKVFRDGFIEREIAKKYTIGAEIALTNDRESKPEEYAAYQEYRIACKAKVDAKLAELKEELEAALV